MGEPKGAQLKVDLSAAKVRKLLKRRGLGVRKIYSGGRNQAVVVHTATGEHLRQLQSILGVKPEREHDD